MSRTKGSGGCSAVGWSSTRTWLGGSNWTLVNPPAEGFPTSTKSYTMVAVTGKTALRDTANSDLRALLSAASTSTAGAPLPWAFKAFPFGPTSTLTVTDPVSWYTRAQFGYSGGAIVSTRTGAPWWQPPHARTISRRTTAGAAKAASLLDSECLLAMADNRKIIRILLYPRIVVVGDDCIRQMSCLVEQDQVLGLCSPPAEHAARVVSGREE